MVLTLKLYNESADGGIAPFPNGEHQATLSDYKYSASRMGNAPSITATLNYPSCLDGEWTDRVYVEFKGEKYYIKGVPSSSRDNNSNLYKHNLEFTSERIKLDSVYFFDVVQGNNENDKPVANSADFSFYGTVEEFKERLNRSMLWSGIGGEGGYNVVIDSGVEFKDALYTASNQYISDALKSMYETYELPYYFVGKKIHIGYAENIIEDPLKYGANHSLISVGKNYTNDKIINRITGTGSDKNIPYYYPNNHPKGVIGAKVVNGNFAVSIFDQKLYADSIELSKPIKFINCISDGSKVVGVRGLNVQYSSGKTWKESKYNPEKGAYDSVSHIFNIKSTINVKYSGDISMTLSINSEDDSVNNNYYIKQTGADISVYYHADTYIESENGFVYYPSAISGLTAKFDDIPTGDYNLYIVIDYINYGPSLNEKIWFPVITGNGCWVNTATNKIIKLRDIGLNIVSDLQPNIGSEIIPYCTKRINVQKQLMPSIYRETDGNERFYVAENNKYKDKDGNDIVFKRPYSKDRPKEYILNNDEIFPTIEGMTNASGLRMDMFSEFAYDKDDNDEIYPEDYENSNLAGKYKHPYFFGKLRKFDGEHGFNLFDHAIEGGEMTFSFKTGKVGGCNFKIGVDEDEGKYNLVQVYETDTHESGYGWHHKGDLKRDENGNVLSGYAPNGGVQTPQAMQQDTVNNEVWIALKKEEETFGMIMPNADNNYRPSPGDEFAIINIDLPEAYVTAAEKRLEDEVIKYMSKNNDYKFTFSAKLSRIFFAENEKFASELNENSKVSVEYDGVIYPMYVSSYSYSVKDTEALPEVQIELNDEIKIFKSSKQKVSEGLSNQIKVIRGKLIKDNNNSKVKIDNVLNFVSKVELEGKKNGDVIEAISSDRQLYLTEKTLINNNLTYIQKEYDNFISISALILKDLSDDALIDSNDAMLKVKSATDSLVRFKNATTAYDKQLSATILSSGVANPTTNFQIARNNYYAELASIKEKISDGTRENMDSIAKDINDIKYLNEVFGEDNNQYSNGAVLSRLLGVKNSDADNPNTVAGLYGGGVEALDDIGFKNNDNKSLMLFAGADGIENVSGAKFRVYEDGTVFANKGVFSGIITKSATTITRDNIAEYSREVIENIQTGNGIMLLQINKLLDLTRIGSYIIFNYPKGSASVGQTHIELPYYTESSIGVENRYELEDVLPLIGTNILVQFVESSGIDCFSVIEIKDDTGPNPTCYQAKNGMLYSLTCDAGSFNDGSGKFCFSIGWKAKLLRHEDEIL